MRLDPTAAGVRLHFEAAEAEILVQVFDDLLAALDEMGPGDAVWERLYPAAFTDVDAADEFREMTGEDLDNARRERLRACRVDVLAAYAPVRRRDAMSRRRGGDRHEVSLEVEGLQRWIMALNDLRLAIGTRLGVTADTDPQIDPFSPTAHDQAVYQWLTAVQDGLVEAAMG